MNTMLLTTNIPMQVPVKHSVFINLYIKRSEIHQKNVYKIGGLPCQDFNVARHTSDNYIVKGFLQKENK